MSEELEAVKKMIVDKISGLENTQIEQIDRIKKAQETVEWRKNRINGFKKILKELFP